MRGWSTDKCSYNSRIRELCIRYKDIDILGIAESHIVGENQLCIPDYTWFGRNRKKHNQAWCGSGGVGILVKKELLSVFNIVITDDTHDDIIWVLFKHKLNNTQFQLCVCYLPPSGSSYVRDAQSFFNELLGQIYVYQEKCPFYIMGDFNSRCGNRPDFIEGVDSVPHREVIDFVQNNYGEMFIEFLLSANCAIINGRNCLNNDFTSFTHKGQAVVDYVVAPYEYVCEVNNLQVIPPLDLITKLQIEKRGFPDHSLLLWEFNIDVDPEEAEHNVSEYVKYDVSNIPDSFMCNSGEMLNSLSSDTNNKTVNEIYSEFIECLYTEMSANIPHKKIKVNISESSRKVKPGKPWWNDDLTLLWNDFVSSEKIWRKNKSRNKSFLKKAMKLKQNALDRAIQKAKRSFWRKKQDDLIELYNRPNSKDFWKYIGNLGIAQERKKQIPFEIVMSDGSISRDKQSVFEKWTTYYKDLLHIDISEESQPDAETLVKPLHSNEPDNEFLTFLDSEITLQELNFCLYKMKIVFFYFGLHPRLME